MFARRVINPVGVCILVTKQLTPGEHAGSPLKIGCSGDYASGDMGDLHEQGIYTGLDEYRTI